MATRERRTAFQRQELQLTGERPGRRFARGLAWAWTTVAAIPGGIELFRLDGNRHIFGDGTVISNHFGNFPESELATLVTHGAEEVAINVLRVPEPVARLSGFLFVTALNIWVETPGILPHMYSLGTSNPEFGGDVLAGIIGYAFAKAPLMIFSYLHRTRQARMATGHA